ncbi:MAG TPA: hypothetical protein VMF59_14725 [Bacteroidota bacterium]|nr:hypothetical protein [Bacteroidota bacterium]
MINELRKAFNSKWSPDRYRRLLERLDARCGAHVTFRVCETPVFIPRDLLRCMERSGTEIMEQIVGNPAYMAASERAVPARVKVPREDPHPLFAAVDFGIEQKPDGQLVPKLIELQGFPTLFAYQPVLCQEYGAVYDLPSGLAQYAEGVEADAYETLLRSAILGTRAPENVILLEIDPLQQKTLPDFLLTSKLCGISVVNIRDIVRKGNRLYYRKGATLVPVDRIYNRIIPEDLANSGARLRFDMSDDIDVEWAGHPNWFFRMSKFSLPFLKHPAVPPSKFLSDALPGAEDLGNLVLKPLFSFAGSGVKVAPTRGDIEAIKSSHRHDYILQQRVEYAGLVDTPAGPTKAEVRILYIWHDRPVAVLNLVRLGRGAQMGVDHNKNMGWVGSSAGFWPV